MNNEEPLREILSLKKQLKERDQDTHLEQLCSVKNMQDLNTYVQDHINRDTRYLVDAKKSTS